MTLTVKGAVADSHALGLPLKNPFGRCSHVSLFKCFKGLVAVTHVSAHAHQRLVPTPDRSVTEDTRRK